MKFKKGDILHHIDDYKEKCIFECYERNEIPCHEEEVLYVYNCMVIPYQYQYRRWKKKIIGPNLVFANSQFFWPKGRQLLLEICLYV